MFGWEEVAFVPLVKVEATGKRLVWEKETFGLVNSLVMSFIGCRYQERGFELGEQELGSY